MSDDAVMPMKFVGRLTGMNLQEIEDLKEENKRLKEAILELAASAGFADHLGDVCNALLLLLKAAGEDELVKNFDGLEWLGLELEKREQALLKDE